LETPIYPPGWGKGRIIDSEVPLVGDMSSLPGGYIDYYPIDLKVWDLLAGMLYRK